MYYTSEERYYDRLAYDQIFHEFMERRMNEQRKEIMKSLSSIVSPNYVEDFAKILCAAFEYNNDEAHKLWDTLCFNASDFYAITQDTKGYFENYKEDESWAVDYE